MPVVVNLTDKNPNTSACISGILIILNALQGEDYKLVTSKAQLLTARLTVKVLDIHFQAQRTNFQNFSLCDMAGIAVTKSVLF